MDRGERSRIGRRLFLAFALLYVLTTHGRSFSDDVFQFEQVGVFVETGDFVMSPDRDPESLGGAGAFMRPGVDGRVYLTLPPGLALAASPLGWIGSKLGFPNPELEQPPNFRQPRGVMFWASLTIPLVMAGTVWLFFLVVTRLSGSIRRGLQGAVVFGMATSAWFYATTFWTQPLATACSFAAVSLLVVRPGGTRAAFAAGLCLGFAVMVRFEFALLVPWYVAFLGASRGDRAKGFLVFLLPLAVVGVGLLAWNQFRFGDPFETRSLHQGPGNFSPKFLGDSVPTMLLGLQQGLLLYSAPVILGIVAIRRAWRANGPLVVLTLGVAVSLLIFYGSFLAWSSPAVVTWGARFLFPLVPLLLLPAFVTPEHDPLRPVWARVLVAVSMVVSFAGVAQRVRLGPPTWWLDDPARAVVAAALLVPLVALAVALTREYRRRA